MINKIKGLLSSIRFWTLTLTAIVALLNGQPLLDVLQVYLSAVVLVGSADSVAKNFAGTK